MIIYSELASILHLPFTLFQDQRFIQTRKQAYICLGRIYILVRYGMLHINPK